MAFMVQQCQRSFATFIGVSAALAILVPPSAAQVTFSGSRVNEFFDYTAESYPAPLDGLGGVPESPSHNNLVLENWNSSAGTPNPTGSDPEPQPFMLRGVNVDFGPQVALPDAGALNRSIGRPTQDGVGIAHRLIGSGVNTNTQTNIINNWKESWTKVDFEWTFGRAAVSLAGDEFRTDLFSPRIEFISGANYTQTGWGFEIDNDGLLRASTWTGGGGGDAIQQDDLTGIQLTSGATYRAYIQAKVVNSSGVDAIEDQFNVYVLSHEQMFDNGDPNTGGAQLVNIFDDAMVSSHSHAINNFAMRDSLQFSLFASGSFNVDGLTIGWLSNTTEADFNDDTLRDAARQELIADRSPGEMLAWKASLGNPYASGDVRLDGDLSSLDIDTLRQQIALGNTNLNPYDLNGDLTNSSLDVDYLVQTIFNTNYGDVDLDGDIDGVDRAVVESNLGTSNSRWQDGDMTGDGMVDEADLAFFPVLQGDFNNDGFVNLADYTVWRDNVGAAESVLPAGSGNGSATVDAGDYSLWKSVFANNGTASLSAVAPIAVPEPTSALLAGATIGLLASLAVVRRRRRRKR